MPWVQHMDLLCSIINNNEHYPLNVHSIRTPWAAMPAFLRPRENRRWFEDARWKNLSENHFVVYEKEERSKRRRWSQRTDDQMRRIPCHRWICTWKKYYAYPSNGKSNFENSNLWTIKWAVWFAVSTLPRHISTVVRLDRPLKEKKINLISFCSKRSNSLTLGWYEWWPCLCLFDLGCRISISQPYGQHIQQCSSDCNRSDVYMYHGLVVFFFDELSSSLSFPAKEIRLKHKAPVLSIVVLDASNQSIGQGSGIPTVESPTIVPNVSPPATTTTTESVSPTSSSPVTSHKVLICSEEQFKVDQPLSSPCVLHGDLTF